ncbi:MAG: DUF1295 domain-containing protein [Bacilli bacterium]|nr:DUF1295 domain-containing protein [Bacilli bacterium]
MMKKIIFAAIAGLMAVACIVLFFAVGPAFNKTQLETLAILGIVCGSSVAYCFIVGTLARNYSQMDKLWSILPAVYCWIIAAKGGMNIRLVIMALLVTLWGIRLTFNFARKGAYTWKFWSGEEDYRWAVLRKNKYLQNPFMWALFNLFFISFYQNFLILLTTLPALAIQTSTAPLNWIDFVAGGACALFLLIETIADEQQWKFQSIKYAMLGEGRKLEELPDPYKIGFNTVGLWNHARHPNYLGEQGFWFALYFFSVAGGLFVYNWSLLGAALLILLFFGSVSFGESISKKKYPLYEDYCRKTSCYIPFKAYIKRK